MPRRIRQRTRAIAEDAGAGVIALPANVGPSAARNAGLAQAGTPLVAFIDSDCVPDQGWLDPLLAHFNDPLVVAVAPRIVPLGVTSPTTLSRYETVRSSLDRGSHARARPTDEPDSLRARAPPSSSVAPRSPTSSSTPRSGVARTSTWCGGWCRPDGTSATSLVPPSAHDGPTSAAAWLGRRAFYGTTAGPLARRHPRSLAPLHTSAWTAAVWVLAAARRPLPAAGVLAASILVLARRLDGLVDATAEGRRPDRRWGHRQVGPARRWAVSPAPGPPPCSSPSCWRKSRARRRAGPPRSGRL